MRRNLCLAVAAALAVVTANVALEQEARACGGCFHNPNETPTVVTDHRMILSVSQAQTTLYDQIRYTGSPQSFAWVLPISGTVDVGLSADVVFRVLDGTTQTQIQPPPQNCPPGPTGCNSGFGGASNSAPSGAAEDAGAPPPVVVTKEQVVGPYETVQLHSTDPKALESWLSTNGFAIPANVQPIVDAYVAEHFDFLALKLLPGQGIQDMRPVRVTTQGASAVLPLRMVSAGTGATVGITLWVVAEGRYEPQNFPTFHIDDGDLAWDWTQGRSNYTDLRAQKEAAGGGKIWELESSTSISPSNFQNQVEYGYYGGGGGGGGAPQSAANDYEPVKDANGNVTQTAEQVRQADMAALFAGIPETTARVTRLRGDIAHSALDADLVMIASQDQGLLSNVHQVTKELNQPLCPVYSGCDQTGTAPRDQAIAQSTNSKGESFSCAAASGRGGSGGGTWLGLGAGFLALSLVKAARRRR